MARARLEIRLLADDDLVIHEFRRQTTALQPDSIQKMCMDALGWLQAYGDQATPRQWEMEVRTARLRRG